MELTYTVTYTKRKTVAITVERDRSIVVRAPLGADPAKIHAAVEARKLWIYEKRRHPQKYPAPPDPPGKELVNGESVLYLGRHYRIELVESGGEVQFTQKFLVPRRLAGQRGAVLRAWYQARAAAKILPRVAHFARTLGVTYNAAKLSNSQYRWGSCTPKNNLTFNWRLIKAPMFVIDYVIVHELAHLLEPNHTPKFWNIIAAQIGQMEKAKGWLKENGGLLEVEV